MMVICPLFFRNMHVAEALNLTIIPTLIYLNMTVFFTNSLGVIPDLKELNANNVFPLYYAIDPSLFCPLENNKSIDVSFYGVGNAYREDWMKKMITEPSNELNDNKFVIAGRNFTIDLGNSKLVGDLSYSAFRDFCCSSKNLSEYHKMVSYRSICILYSSTFRACWIWCLYSITTI